MSAPYSIEPGSHLAKRYPKLRAGVVSNTADSIIRSYMGAGWGNGQYNNCNGVATPVPASVYKNDLLAERALHSTQMSTFYIGAGSPPTFGRGHSALRSALYTSTVVNGIPLRTWLGDVIDGLVVEVGP